MSTLEKEVQMDNVEIGKRIKEAREAIGYRSNEVADYLDITKDQYSRIECGRSRCKSEYLFYLSSYLNVSVDYLLFGDQKSKIEHEINKLLKGKSLKMLLAIREMIEIRIKNGWH